MPACRGPAQRSAPTCNGLNVAKLPEMGKHQLGQAVPHGNLDIDFVNDLCKTLACDASFVKYSCSLSKNQSADLSHVLNIQVIHMSLRFMGQAAFPGGLSNAWKVIQYPSRIITRQIDRRFAAIGKIHNHNV